MDKITRQEAKEQNSRYYFTGKPCPKNHISKRVVNSATCYECDRLSEDTRAKSIRTRVIAKLGGVCKRCGFSDIRALQIDHVNGGGKKEISGSSSVHSYYSNILNGDGNSYQVLCANCNWIKRSEQKEHGKTYYQKFQS